MIMYTQGGEDKLLHRRDVDDVLNAVAHAFGSTTQLFFLYSIFHGWKRRGPAMFSPHLSGPAFQRERVQFERRRRLAGYFKSARLLFFPLLLLSLPLHFLLFRQSIFTSLFLRTVHSFSSNR